MIDIKTEMNAIAQQLGRPCTVLKNGSVMLDYPLKYSNGTERLQQVTVQRVANAASAKGKNVVFFLSICGIYTPALALKEVLKDANRTTHAAFSLRPSTGKDGAPIEMLCVSASPVEDMLKPGTFSDILFEVASLADLVESKYFAGTDQF
jgi:hypothetical protein